MTKKIKEPIQREELGIMLRKEYTLPRKEYALSLDDDATLRQKGDVDFLMELRPNADPNKIRSTLERIAEDKIGYANYMNIGYLVCVTDQATYESISGATLEKVARRNQKKTRYTAHGYREMTSSEVHPDLRREVVRMFLNCVHRK